LRNDLGIEPDERNYAKQPFSISELKEIFEDGDPRDFINPKSIPYKTMGLAGKTLSREETFKLIAEDPNLLKRPITIVGSEFVAGFDRARLRTLLS
jgi:regulatory protein spx